MDSLPRPTLPPVLLLTGTLWVGMFCGESLVWHRLNLGGLSSGAIVALLFGALLCSFIALAGSKFRKTSLLLFGFMSCGLCLGLGVAGYVWTHQIGQKDAVLSFGSSNVTMDITSDVSKGSYGLYSQAYVREINGVSCSRILVRVEWPDDASACMGERCVVQGNFVELGYSDFARSRWQQGFVASLKVKELTQHQ